MRTDRYKRYAFIFAAILTGLFLTSCSKEQMPNQSLVPDLDLKRFMGTWYVHGHTPTFLDKQAYAATETYELSDDGRILTAYRYRKGSLQGKEKTYNPVGKVYDQDSQAEWRMKFFGLFNAPYYILYVDSEYQSTVVGHPGKKMAWIMSRSPQMDDELYGRLKSELVKRDYQLTDFRRIPHN